MKANIEHSIEKQHEYWRRRELNYVDYSFITNFKKGQCHTIGASSYRNCQFLINTVCTKQAMQVCNHSDLSLYIFLLVSLKYVIFKYIDGSRISIISRNYYTNDDMQQQSKFILLQDNLEPNASVKDNVLRTRKTVIEGYANQDYDLSQQVSSEDLNIMLSNMVLCSLTNIHADRPLMHIACLHIAFTKKEGNISCELRYDTNNLEDSLIIELARQLHYVIESAISDFIQPIVNIRLMSEESNEQMLTLSRGLQASIPSLSLLHLFEEQARQTPNQDALIFGDTVITYDRLNKKSNRFARYLMDCNIRPGKCIPLFMSRGIDMIVAILAVWKAGCYYIPLDKNDAQERIHIILKESEAEDCISDEELGFVSKSCRQHIITNINKDALYSADYDENPDLLFNGEELSYIIYTSGSTGTPKGVMLCQRNIANSLVWRKKEYNLGQSDVVLQLFSYTFDGFITSLFTPIISGSSVVILNDDSARCAQRLCEAIELYKVTHFISVPSLFDAILECANPQMLRTLKIVTLAGDVASANLIARSIEKVPGLEFVNEYGPTEDAVVATYNRPMNASSAHFIGKPIDNTNVYILDSQLNLLPKGIYGEIFISGHGLAKGYLKNDELTNEKFFYHSMLNNERLYRSGDIGRWRPEGTIEMKGRKDNQINLRGFRIETDEIRYQLLAMEQVEEAYILVTGQSISRMLCAVLKVWGGVTENDIRMHITQRLPYYMIPQHYIFIDHIPANTNGKVDMSRLAQMANESLQCNNRHDPKGDIEIQLCEIWKEILGLAEVGASDNFFVMGGHSLKATGLLSKISTTFHVNLPLNQIFETPTIKQLAKIIYNSQESGYDRLRHIPDAEQYPLSAEQKRMYLLQNEDDGQMSYNIPVAFLFEGPLNVEKLKNCIDNIVNRYEVFRTTFEWRGENLVQIVHNQMYWEIRHYDIDASAQIDEKLTSVLCPFDLSKLPLFQVCVFSQSDDTHYILFDFHHIVIDGVSLQLFISELGGLYSGQNPEKPKFQYRDYVEWQSARKNTQQYKKLRNYWKERIQSYSAAPLNLSYDYSSQAASSYVGSRLSFTLDKEVICEIKTFIDAIEITPFVFYHACLVALLYKYTGERDIIIGTSVAGRAHPDLVNMPGLFINTVPIFTKVNPRQSFIDFLQEDRAEILSNLTHSDYQFDEIVKMLKNYGMNNTPFHIFLIVQEMNVRQSAFDGIRLQPYPVTNHTAKFDLNFEINMIDSDLFFVIEYPMNLFNRDTICALSNAFQALVKQVVDTPQKSLETIDLMSPLIVNNISVPSERYYCKDTIVSIFEKKAVTFPENIAVEVGEDTITYEQLNQWSNRISIELTERVNGKEIVAVHCERSIFMIASVIGILKAGCAYLPLDTKHPAERISFMLDDCEVKVLIADTTLSSDVHYSGIVLTNKECQIDPNVTYSNLSISVEATDLAYIIYTSGTTGVPKGAMIEHKNVVNLIMENQSLFHFTDKDVWTMFHSLCFDFSVWEMFGALLYGGKFIIISSELARDVRGFCELLEEKDVTVLNQTPTAFYSLQHEAVKVGYTFPALRYVIFGGETLNPYKTSAWKDKYPHVKLINMYGITETTVHVTYKEISDAEIIDTRSNIGYPIHNVYAYILDSNMRMCPVGAVGEIYVGGYGVCRGYINRESLTNQKFIADPFFPERIVYKTGDLAKQLGNGEFIYYGRSDRQVKVRGHRVELMEIENVIMDYPMIDEAIVCFINKEGCTPYIAAYYTACQKIPQAELRDYISSYMPSYMLPAYILQIDAIPRTKNGKVDEALLPEPGTAIDYEYDAKQTLNNNEKKIRLIWARVLNLPEDKINPESNFFTMGGDSIKAIHLLNQLETEYQKKIKISDLYTNATILSMATFIGAKQDNIDSMQNNPAQEQVYPIKSTVISDLANRGFDASLIDDVYPMSDIELGMIYYYIKDPQSSTYHDQILFQIECGVSEISIVEKALGMLCQKHPILRTLINLGDYNEPVHIVYKQFLVDYQYFDLTTEDQTQQISFIKNHMANDRKQGFDMNYPLWRVLLFQTKMNTMLFLLVTHHAILDGWSIAQFQLELSEAMAMCRAGKHLVFSPLAHTYKRYIAEQVAVGTNQKILDFWKNELSGYIRLPMPLIEPSSIVCKRKNDLRHIVPKPLLAQLQSITEIYQTDLKTIYLSACICTLNMLSYENDFVLGIVNSNRPICQDGDKILGCFLNTVPFRAELKNGWAYADILKFTVNKIQQLKEYDQLSLSKITQALNLSEKENPLFDCIFNYVNFGIINTRINDLNIADDVSTNTMLDFVVDTTLDDHVIQITHETLIDTSEAEKLMCYYMEILSQFAKSINTIMRKDNIMVSANLANQLSIIQGEKIDYPYDTPTHVLFEQQVIAAPYRTAVVYKGKCLSYDQLNKKANAVAWKIRELGVSANDCVAVIVDISIDMITAMLSVFKAGGVFLPIDRKTPESRIRHFLENSNCKVVLTHSHLVNEALSDVQIVVLDDYVFVSNETDCRNLPNMNRGADLAYMIYTSGTTGTPKAVMIEHHSLINLCYWHNSEYQITCNDRATKYASYGFDVSIWEMMPYLIAGAEVHIIPEDILLEMNQLDEYFVANHITVAYLPTPVCEEYMKVSRAELRYLLTAGDKLRIFVNGNYILANDYGPTETTVIATAMKVEQPYNNIPIGRPISNLDALVVDRNRDIQPMGIVGELCISGVGLARGYYNDANLTDQKFFCLHSYDNRRVYATSDLARMLPDGNIEYLGRNDRQIKLRGYRIEQEEIERNILSFEDIHHAVVMKSDLDEIHAFLVSDTTISLAELKQHLEQRLPEYMIPKQFTIISELPLTSNGKIDYRQLGTMIKIYEPYKKETSCILPESETELLLHDIFCQVLGIKQISTEDSFFDMGGDSIKAMQVISRLNGFELDVRVNDIFDCKTIKKLSATIGTSTRVIDQRPITGVSTLSPIQLWFFDNAFHNANHWNQAFLLHNQKEFTHQNLELVFQQLVEHHDALRARVTHDQRQMYIDTIGYPVEIRICDLCEYSDYADMITIDATKMQTTLDICNGPTMAIKNYKTIDGDYLMLIVHHLLIDGVSWRILFEDITQLMHQLKHHQPLSLPRKTSSYFSYVEAIGDYITTKDLSDEIAYWMTELSKPHDVIAKCDSGTDHLAKNFKTISFALDEANTHMLVHSASNTLETPLLGLLIYCLGMALKAETGGRSFQVLLEAHGREEELLNLNLTRTVGWFTEIYPFRIEISSSKDKRQHIHEVWNALTNASTHRFSYGLLRFLGSEEVKHSLSLNTDNNIVFNYLGDFDNSTDLSAFTISDIYLGNVIDSQACLPESISVTAYIMNQKLKIDIAYDTISYPEDLITNLMDNIELQLYSLNGKFGSAQMKHLPPTRAILENVEAFNEVFLNDCFYQAIVPVVRHFGSDINALFANIFSIYASSNVEKAFEVRNESIATHDVFDLLRLMGIQHEVQTRCENVCEEIINYLETGKKAVIVNLDCFYIKNKHDMYQKIHWSHAILVYGFDQQKQEFTVIDGDDIFSLNYHSQTISFEELAAAYRGYNQYFNILYKSGSLFALSELPHKTADFQIDAKKLTFETIHKNRIRILDSIDSYTSYYQDFVELISDSQLVVGNADDLYYTFNDMLAAKKMERYKIQQILLESYLNILIDTIVNELNFICNVFQKINLRKKVKEPTQDQLIKKWKHVLELEEKYNQSLIRLCDEEYSERILS